MVLTTLSTWITSLLCTKRSMTLSVQGEIGGIRKLRIMGWSLLKIFFKGKGIKLEEENYHTQDKLYNQNFDNNTLGVDQEGRPSNAMQTQTLIMPFSERQRSDNGSIRNEDMG